MGDMVGVWIAPVTAQVMMTFLDVAMVSFSLGSMSGCVRMAGIASAPPFWDAAAKFFMRLTASSCAGKCAKPGTGSTISKKH
jgi:hypothetical protein